MCSGPTPDPIDDSLIEDLCSRLGRHCPSSRNRSNNRQGRRYAVNRMVERVLARAVNQPGAFVDPPPRLGERASADANARRGQSSADRAGAGDTARRMRTFRFSGSAGSCGAAPVTAAHIAVGARIHSMTVVRRWPAGAVHEQDRQHWLLSAALTKAQGIESWRWTIGPIRSLRTLRPEPSCRHCATPTS